MSAPSSQHQQPHQPARSDSALDPYAVGRLLATARPDRLQRTRLTEGYDTDEVDAFLARLKRDLLADPPRITAAELRDTRFTPVRIRPGYRMDEIDDLLDAAACMVDELTARTELAVTPHPADVGRIMALADRELLPKSRMAEGYDLDEVDAFLDRLERELPLDPPGITAREVRDTRFTPVRMKVAYASTDVDNLLDDVVGVLEGRGEYQGL